ncbi:hypothetical protein C8J57DRAFT_1459126 [Mycena rebaudengoi]|nr:hypothetical protein C8J57DRAFT_1459126 [Mycena rebaudengoi]
MKSKTPSSWTIVTQPLPLPHDLAMIRVRSAGSGVEAAPLITSPTVTKPGPTSGFRYLSRTSRPRYPALLSLSMFPAEIHAQLGVPQVCLKIASTASDAIIRNLGPKASFRLDRRLYSVGGLSKFGKLLMEFPGRSTSNILSFTELTSFHLILPILFSCAFFVTKKERLSQLTAIFYGTEKTYAFHDEMVRLGPGDILKLLERGVLESLFNCL